MKSDVGRYTFYISFALAMWLKKEWLMQNASEWMKSD
jgi:hypothetical protein